MLLLQQKINVLILFDNVLNIILNIIMLINIINIILSNFIMLNQRDVNRYSASMKKRARNFEEVYLLHFLLIFCNLYTKK